ncbi:putative E3 ubiquitin-protein ligase [Sesbania bispinosa]|nr:putative E3 ubiquitin-protein ligase [Sesbania bispinosa]
MCVFVVPWNGAISQWIEDIERFERSCCRCEMEIYLEHGISSPKKTVQVSVPLIADKSETENVQVKATVKDVGLDEMQVGSSQGLGVVGDGQRDVGPDNVAAGGSEGVRDVGPKIVAACGNEGVVTDARPKIVRDVGPKIVADAGSEGVRDAGAQKVEYDEVEPEIMQNLPNTKEIVAGSESSDDLVRGVHFEDNEEERALGADERTTSRGQNDDGNVEGFAPPDMENMHIMEEDYETEELHSDAESSDGEGGTKPRISLMM